MERRAHLQIHDVRQSLEWPAAAVGTKCRRTDGRTDRCHTHKVRAHALRYAPHSSVCIALGWLPIHFEIFSTRIRYGRFGLDNSSIVPCGGEDVCRRRRRGTCDWTLCLKRRRRRRTTYKNGIKCYVKRRRCVSIIRSRYVAGNFSLYSIMTVLWNLCWWWCQGTAIRRRHRRCSHRVTLRSSSYSLRPAL